jgi:hypothetical protein
MDWYWWVVILVSAVLVSIPVGFFIGVEWLASTLFPRR